MGLAFDIIQRASKHDYLWGKNGMHFFISILPEKMIFIEKEICNIFWISFLLRKSFNFLSLQIIVP